MISNTTAVRRFQEFMNQANYRYWFNCQYAMCGKFQWLLCGVDEFSKEPFTAIFDADINAMRDQVFYSNVNEAKLGFVKLAAEDLQSVMVNDGDDIILILGADE